MQLRAATASALAVALTARLLGVALADDGAAKPAPSPPPAAPDPDAPDAPGNTDPVDTEWNAISTGHAAATDVARAPDDTEPVDADPPTTGALQAGVYADSDHTTVYRSLALISSTFGHWIVNARGGVDTVTSASIDVRSSPALGAVDTVTSASGRSSTSGGEMTDTRYEFTGGGGWNDTHGHVANVTASVASERDYKSVSAGWNGSIDILDRTTTLLGGVNATDNRISSVLDMTLAKKMFATGWTAGIARVLTPDDAVRLRYDGRAAEGYNASPYRSVRFGDWTTSTSSNDQVLFANTIGPAGGLPERVPERRVSHALVLEWVHSLRDDIVVHPEARVAHDTWGVDSLTASIDLRVAEPSWRLQLGYRYYLQSAADFFLDKYVLAPEMYPYFASDKELGGQRGHLVNLGLSFVLFEPKGPNGTRLLLDTRVDAFKYAYPGFTLLPSRTSTFVSVGLTWEP